MHRNRFTGRGRWSRALRAARAGLLISLAAGAHAAGPPAVELSSLRQAFEAAWARQPEALALAHRREAVQAQQQAAGSWTPEPAALELAARADRQQHGTGLREFEVGLAIPLWLPGERGRSQALAAAEARAVESRAAAARLKLAASVREAWWSWQRARAEVVTAQAQLDQARRIAADVAQRLKAGDLARADQHQADAAVALAESGLAGAQAALATQAQALPVLTALALPAAGPGAAPLAAESEPEPVPEPEAQPAMAPAAGAAAPPRHAELQALQDRTAVAEHAAALAATQTRANAELTIAMVRERSGPGEAAQQALTLGLRIPFGQGPRQGARVAAARADAVELRAQWALEQARLAGEHGVARARVQAARAQLAAAQRRGQLARELRGFFDKSFRLGETDLPTRLRIEADAADADRQLARAHIELAAAISAWRQALGLLPP